VFQRAGCVQPSRRGRGLNTLLTDWKVIFKITYNTVHYFKITYSTLVLQEYVLIKSDKYNSPSPPILLARCEIADSLPNQTIDFSSRAEKSTQ